jgi:hypothetical protein
MVLGRMRGGRRVVIIGAAGRGPLSNVGEQAAHLGAGAGTKLRAVGVIDLLHKVHGVACPPLIASPAGLREA